jgi:hypothetical protein
MARARSPEYPAISLKEAIDRVKMVYEKDYQNRLPKHVVAEHMGYKGLSGASLPVISALTKYGLLEGRGDETRVSDLAVALIAHPSGTAEHYDALKRASMFPELFAELDERFPDGKASEQAIRSYLLTRKFIPGAADAAIRAYRDTKALVEAESQGYVGEEEQPSEKAPLMNEAAINAIRGAMPKPLPATPPKPGMLQEVFNLDEGPVTLSFPSALSQESYEDLKDQLELFLRRAQRRAVSADITARYDDPEYRAMRDAEMRRRASQEGDDDEVPPMGNMEKVGGVWQPKRGK